MELNCSVYELNGMPNHIHYFFLLEPKVSIAQVTKQIKGSSSHFINMNNLIKEKFAWQTGYAAYSVSKSIGPNVKKYIQNQKEHHKIKTFQQEFQEFLNKFGFNK